jgi:hypothetical protein
MRAVEVGAIALGLATVLSGACSKSGSSSQGSKEPSATNQPSAQAQQPKSQAPAVGGGPTEPGAAHAKPTATSAVSSMVAARCDREVRCNNVGQGKTYKTRDECVSKVQKDEAKNINDKVCTGGIDEGNLNRCIQSLQVEECGNPMSMFQRAEACKDDGICVKKKK